MFKKHSLYWICQAAGWSVIFFIIVFFYFNLSLHKIEHFFILTSVNVASGIFFTHLMRMILVRYDYLNKPINRQIIFFITLTLGFTIVYAAFDILIERAFNLRGADALPIPFLKELARDSIVNFFILFIWNLIYYIYHFVEHNRRHEVNTLKLQAAVKELELKTIKAHINPHFIFNALNSIRALVVENPERARTAITELSNILRSSMQTEKSETVPLEKELHIVENYLALEQMRFEERLKVIIDIPDNTLHLQVPPMMLQTLVENAIKHGISKKIEGGTVRVLSRLKNHMHELLVQNTGQLQVEISNEGFGISSTENRLKLLYHGNAAFSLKNLDSQTVEAKIIIPINQTDRICIKPLL